jgi:hypothetical protein
LNRVTPDAKIFKKRPVVSRRGFSSARIPSPQLEPIRTNPDIDDEIGNLGHLGEEHYSKTRNEEKIDKQSEEQIRKSNNDHKNDTEINSISHHVANLTNNDFRDFDDGINEHHHDEKDADFMSCQIDHENDDKNAQNVQDIRNDATNYQEHFFQDENDDNSFNLTSTSLKFSMSSSSSIDESLYGTTTKRAAVAVSPFEQQRITSCHLTKKMEADGMKTKEQKNGLKHSENDKNKNTTIQHTSISSKGHYQIPTILPPSIEAVRKSISAGNQPKPFVLPSKQQNDSSLDESKVQNARNFPKGGNSGPKKPSHLSHQGYSAEPRPHSIHIPQVQSVKYTTTSVMGENTPKENQNEQKEQILAKSITTNVTKNQQTHTITPKKALITSTPSKKSTTTTPARFKMKYSLNSGNNKQNDDKFHDILHNTSKIDTLKKAKDNSYTNRVQQATAKQKPSVPVSNATIKPVTTSRINMQPIMTQKKEVKSENKNVSQSGSKSGMKKSGSQAPKNTAARSTFASRSIFSRLDITEPATTTANASKSQGNGNTTMLKSKLIQNKDQKNRDGNQNQPRKIPLSKTSLSSSQTPLPSRSVPTKSFINQSTLLKHTSTTKIETNEARGEKTNQNVSKNSKNSKIPTQSSKLSRNFAVSKPNRSEQLVNKAPSRIAGYMTRNYVNSDDKNQRNEIQIEGKDANKTVNESNNANRMNESNARKIAPNTVTKKPSNPIQPGQPAHLMNPSSSFSALSKHTGNKAPIGIVSKGSHAQTPLKTRDIFQTNQNNQKTSSIITTIPKSNVSSMTTGQMTRISY